MHCTLVFAFAAMISVMQKKKKKKKKKKNKNKSALNRIFSADHTETAWRKSINILKNNGLFLKNKQTF